MTAVETAERPRFYGDCRRSREIGALHLAELDATVPAHQVLEHSHDEAHFVLVLRGLYVSSAQAMPDVSDGLALVFNPPGTTHRDRFATSGGRFLTLALPADAWHAAEKRKHAFRAARRMDMSALLVACRLRAELRRWDMGSSLAVETACNTLIAAMTSARPLGMARPPWLDRILDRLRDSTLDVPAMNVLAHEAGVHPVYLSRAFRRHVGCSPGAYVRRMRLEYAASLLARPGRLRLSDVAQRAGFYDQSHLHRSLAGETGLTPADLRRLVDTVD